MARSKGQSPTVPAEQEEMIVFYTKLKGSSDTLQKGFNAFSEAILGVSGSRPQPKLLQDIADRGDGANPNGRPVVVESDDEEEPEEASPSPVQREGGEGRRHRSVVKFLPDFDLGGNGTKWQEYAAQKSPQTENEKYLVATLWITDHARHETFNGNQVFTCFRSMQWPEPDDFTQPLRAMKRDKSYFDVPKKGQWKLTGIGKEAAGKVGKA